MINDTLIRNKYDVLLSFSFNSSMATLQLSGYILAKSKIYTVDSGFVFLASNSQNRAEAFV